MNETHNYSSAQDNVVKVLLKPQPQGPATADKAGTVGST